MSSLWHRALPTLGTAAAVAWAVGVQACGGAASAPPARPAVHCPGGFDLDPYKRDQDRQDALARLVDRLSPPSGDAQAKAVIALSDAVIHAQPENMARVPASAAQDYRCAIDFVLASPNTTELVARAAELASANTHVLESRGHAP